MLDDVKTGILYARIYLKLRPTISKLKELCRMKFSWNMISQAALLLAQGANQASGLIPANAKTPVMLGIAVLQSVGAFIAHFSNPDGTSAKVGSGPAK